jgi:hypothetical protein
LTRERSVSLCVFQRRLLHFVRNRSAFLLTGLDACVTQAVGTRIHFSGQNHTVPAIDTGQGCVLAEE